MQSAMSLQADAPGLQTAYPPQRPPPRANKPAMRAAAKAAELRPAQDEPAASSQHGNHVAAAARLPPHQHWATSEARSAQPPPGDQRFREAAQSAALGDVPRDTPAMPGRPCPFCNRTLKPQEWDDHVAAELAAADEADWEDMPHPPQQPNR